VISLPTVDVAGAQTKSKSLYLMSTIAGKVRRGADRLAKLEVDLLQRRLDDKDSGYTST